MCLHIVDAKAKHQTFWRTNTSFAELKKAERPGFHV
jgi:hypothetical protein